MYAPSYFNESRPEVLRGLLEQHPLGALITHSADGLDASHIPFEFVAPTADALFGVLRAHVARANPVWQRGGDCLVVFQGASAYVSPSLYEEKPVSGKVVPTWNYAVVHAHGQLRAIEDPAWIMALLARLTDRHEADRAAPWAVQDAPRDFTEKLIAAIVGIESPVQRLQGTWKMSQNRSLTDQAAIAADTRLQGMGPGAGVPGML